MAISNNAKAAKNYNRIFQHNMQTLTYNSPCGKMRLAAAGGKICLCDWISSHRHTRNCRIVNQNNPYPDTNEDKILLYKASEQLDEYFAGERRSFDLPLQFEGTDFQKDVWLQLLNIDYGRTVDYGEVSMEMGNPDSVRAVAHAVAANRLSVLVPCHRVVGRNEIGGYAGGGTTKVHLLSLERTGNPRSADLERLFAAGQRFLMEGALGERLKREFGLDITGPTAMAPLVDSEAGREALKSLWTEYLGIAKRYSLPFLATTPTRRLNNVTAGREEMVRLARENVAFLRYTLGDDDYPAFAGAMMGCCGDAYSGQGCLDEEEAYKLHSHTAAVFKEAGADFLFAALMPTLPELKGMVRAMSETGLPYIVSLSLREDGCIADGTPVNQVIRAFDYDLSLRPPLCYMANCVHPAVALEGLRNRVNRRKAVQRRFKGLQANTAEMPFSKLDNSDCLLVTSSPQELADDMANLDSFIPMQVLGGCCGTDGTYLEELAKLAIQPLRRNL